MLQQALPVSLLPGLVGAPLVCAIAAYRLLPIGSKARQAVTIAAVFVGLAIVVPLPFIGSFAFLWASVIATAFAATLVTSRILLDARRKAAEDIPTENNP